MEKHTCTILMTAKDSFKPKSDRLFLVQGENDDDCVRKFHAHVRKEDVRWELALDLRTIRYLGDGAPGLSINNPDGIVEPDTSNNCGYDVKVVRS